MVLSGAKGWREPESESARRTCLKGMLSLISRFDGTDEDAARRVRHRHRRPSGDPAGELEVAGEQGRVCHWRVRP